MFFKSKYWIIETFLKKSSSRMAVRLLEEKITFPAVSDRIAVLVVQVQRS